MADQFSLFVRWFRGAAPYIHVHRGKTFVVQFEPDNRAVAAANSLLQDLALLNSLGIRVVIVFAARSMIETRLDEEGYATTIHDGIRVTSSQAMVTVKDTVGRMRIEIEARLSMAMGNTPMSNARIRVSSGNYVTARPIGIIDGIDFQFTGTVKSIDVDAINRKLSAGEIVLIPPLGYSISGEAYNLAAPALAAQVAAALDANKLIYVIDGDTRLLDKDGQALSEMTQTEAEALLQAGADDGHLQPYLQSAISAGREGVARCHFLPRAHDGAILEELFTRDGAGSMITATAYDDMRRAAVGDITGILDLIEPLETSGALVTRSREKLELEIERFVVLERDAVIIGCGALYPFPEHGLAEVACLAIHPDYHNSGRGEQLYARLELEAKRQHLNRLFVLTTQADHWFFRHGFVATDLDALPVEKKQLYNYQRKSRILVKDL